MYVSRQKPFSPFFLLFRWLPAGARDGGWKWAGNAAYVTGVTAALIFYLSGKLERRARVKDRRSPDILFRKCSVICMVVVCYSAPSCCLRVFPPTLLHRPPICPSLRHTFLLGQSLLYRIHATGREGLGNYKKESSSHAAVPAPTAFLRN